MTKQVKFLAALTALLVTTTVISANAFAFPLTSKNWTQKPVLGLFYVSGFNFDSIVGLSNCSGSIVRFKSSVDTDKALMLTNGHCYEAPGTGMINPNQVVVNARSVRDVAVLGHDASVLKTYETARVLYSTMTMTDVSLYELNETYADITRETGSHALTIADQPAPMGVAIQVPSGYWERTYSCNSEATIPELHEAGYVFKNSIRYSSPGCETIGGTSGSPVVSTATGEIIGINNTGNDDGERCTLDNPCEVDNQGQITVRKGASYAQQTYLFYGCLSTGPDRLDLNLPTCQLPKAHP